MMKAELMAPQVKDIDQAMHGHLVYGFIRDLVEDMERTADILVGYPVVAIPSNTHENKQADQGERARICNKQRTEELMNEILQDIWTALYSGLKTD